jgi:hypothetical protein
VKGDLEAVALGRRAHGTGQYLVAGREVRDGRQLALAAVDGVANLDGVAAAAEQQAEPVDGRRQVGAR